MKARHVWAPLPLLVGALLTIVFSTLLMGLEANQPIWVMAIFVLCIAVLVRLRLYLPHGESMAPASTIIAASLLLFSFPLCLYVVFAGVLSSIVLRLGSSVALWTLLVDASRSTLASTIAIAAYFLLGGNLTGVDYSDRVFLENPVPSLALFAVYHMIDFSMEEFGLNVYSRDAKLGIRQILELFRLLGPAHLALSSIGVLMAILYGHLGVWALGLVTGMLLLFRHAMRLYLDVAEAYDDTIKALSKAIDVHEDILGPQATDVENVARILGRELGLTRTQLEVLSRAALLTNLGKIGMDDPELSAEGLPEHHSTRAAKILSKAEGLHIVGRLVEHQDIHYDRLRLPPHEILLAQCLLVSKTFCSEVRNGLTSTDFIRYLRKESGTLFHPKVVRAMTALLDAGMVAADVHGLGEQVSSNSEHARTTLSLN